MQWRRRFITLNYIPRANSLLFYKHSAPLLLTSSVKAKQIRADSPNSRDSILVVENCALPYYLVDNCYKGSLRHSAMRLLCFCPSSRRTMLRPSSRFQVTIGFGDPVATHRSLILPPSWVTIPSEDSSSIMSGGITTSMYPIWSEKQEKNIRFP